MYIYVVLRLQHNVKQIMFIHESFSRISQLQKLITLLIFLGSIRIFFPTGIRHVFNIVYGCLVSLFHTTLRRKLYKQLFHMHPIIYSLPALYFTLQNVVNIMRLIEKKRFKVIEI